MIERFIDRYQHSIHIWWTFCRSHRRTLSIRTYNCTNSCVIRSQNLRNCNDRRDISAREFTRVKQHSRNNTIQYMSGDTRMCECRGGAIEEQIRERGDYHCLPMYNSEFFKTVCTKIGRMCSYIICAKSYLSGQ